MEIETDYITLEHIDPLASYRLTEDEGIQVCKRFMQFYERELLKHPKFTSVSFVSHPSNEDEDDEIRRDIEDQIDHAEIWKSLEQELGPKKR